MSYVLEEYGRPEWAYAAFLLLHVMKRVYEARCNGSYDDYLKAVEGMVLFLPRKAKEQAKQLLAELYGELDKINPKGVDMFTKSKHVERKESQIVYSYCDKIVDIAMSVLEKILLNVETIRIEGFK